MDELAQAIKTVGPEVWGEMVRRAAFDGMCGLVFGGVLALAALVSFAYGYREARQRYEGGLFFALCALPFLIGVILVLCSVQSVLYPQATALDNLLGR